MISVNKFTIVMFSPTDLAEIQKDFFHKQRWFFRRYVS